MISEDDLVAMGGLSPDEIAAAVRPGAQADVSAFVLDYFLLQMEYGPARIRGLLLDDLRVALKSGDLDRARTMVEDLGARLRAGAVPHGVAGLA